MWLYLYDNNIIYTLQVIIIIMLTHVSYINRAAECTYTIPFTHACIWDRGRKIITSSSVIYIKRVNDSLLLRCLESIVKIAWCVCNIRKDLLCRRCRRNIIISFVRISCCIGIQYTLVQTEISGRRLREKFSCIFERVRLSM